MQQNDKDNEIPVPEARHNLAQREAEGETLGSWDISCESQSDGRVS